MRRRKSPTLGILRLDYDYPPALGDIDHPDTFSYDVVYRVVPGLTFEICQSGVLPEEVQHRCVEAVEFLNASGVSGISGDCGFMVHIQDLITNHTDKPVFLSALGQLPMMMDSIDRSAEVAVFTANSDSLMAVELALDRLSGLRAHSHRLRIVGCQNIPGFDAVAKGKKVDTEEVLPGLLKLTREFLQNHPKVEAILFECTELPPYANALRNETGLPVYDAVTNCDAFMSGFQSSKNFGLEGWQEDWAGVHREYHFGENLTPSAKAILKSKPYEEN